MTTHEPTTLLQDAPAWLYLLREFELLYRPGFAGGSKIIRAHRKRVRDQLAAIIDANPPVLSREPDTKPVVAHLPRAFDLGSRAALSSLARATERIAPLLTWEYGYERVPRTLVRKYAYCEVLGPQGPILSETLILGFVLFAPKTTYPQHHHKDIEESYISVAGNWSENDMAVYAPGSLILNRSGEQHHITTGERDPCLLAYAWMGPAARLKQPGMTFSKKTGRRGQAVT